MNVMPESGAPPPHTFSPPNSSSRRRRRKWPWVLAIVVLLLFSVFVVADRVSVGMAEDRVAAAIADSTAEYNVAADKTRVDIKGFPFLTQVARGKFGKVKVTMRDVKVRPFNLFRLDADLSTVRVPRSVMTGSTAEEIKVDRVIASGVISPQQFADALNVPRLVLRAESGVLLANGFVSFEGIGAQIDAKLRPFISQNRIGLELLEFSSASRVSSAAVQLIRNYLAQGMAAPQLPFEVKLTDISAGDGNIRISGEARNVSALR